jgi:hypothetical protein
LEDGKISYEKKGKAIKSVGGLRPVSYTRSRPQVTFTWDGVFKDKKNNGICELKDDELKITTAKFRRENFPRGVQTGSQSR